MKKRVILIVAVVLFSFFSSTVISHQTMLIDSVENKINNKLVDVPDEFDWRDYNGSDWTTPIRDQLQDLCGSCWGFGALGGLEAAYKIWMNDPSLEVDFSEQYLLSCSPGGCNGWYLSWAIKWIENNGMISEHCFPYQANDTIPCEAKCENWRDEYFGITSYHRVESEVTSIQNALLTYGPLPASMTVYEDFYPDFSGGVYEYKEGEIVFGHCVTIVGYSNNWGSNNEGYWICKNSWGTEWGEEGWFRIAYGQCNIENGVYYVTGPNYPPEIPEAPIGNNTGVPGEMYQFSTTTFDHEENTIFYQFDWGDGESTRWMGPYASNETIHVNHSWVTKGTYEIKVKAKDHHGLESDWSEPLTLSVPKNTQFMSSLHYILKNLFRYNVMKTIESIIQD